jgi:hypothetical protein
LPAGNITQIDRNKRMADIQRLLGDGKSANEISREMDIPLPTVQRNITYVEDLAVTDLTPEVQAEKRQEIYTELLEISAKAKAAFDKYIDDKPGTAKQFLSSWMTALDKRANLFGLSQNNYEIQTQVNTLNVAPVTDVISQEDADRISKALIAKHENTVRRLNSQR